MTATKQKYKAVPVYWDLEKRSAVNIHDVEIWRCKGKLKLPETIVRFDSQHEFKVYLELCRMYGEDRIVRQFPYGILPPCRCYPNGKTWKVDFTVTMGKPWSGIELLVEAKGVFLPEFANTLANFELYSRIDFRRLHVVFTDSIPTTNKVVRALMRSRNAANLLTLEELKQLQTLS